MKPRSVRQRPEKALSAAKSAVAVLLALLVLQSGFLGGLPAVEAQSAGLSARDGARVAKEAAGTAGAQNLDATPALAADLGEEHGALLQLAAGGFRDMTRIAAGQPSIWPGICDDNADAIVATLDLLIESLGTMRRRVAERDHDSLLEVLQRAATARRAMSERVQRPEELVEVRIPVEDRPGMFAEIAVLATELGINIFDVEIAHSVEGDRGVLVVVIDVTSAPIFTEALAAKGHRSSTSPVGTIR